MNKIHHFYPTKFINVSLLYLHRHVTHPTAACGTLDARVENFPCVGSPFPIIALLVVYVYFVTAWGPRWMENRKAYDLRGIIKIYNLFQIFANLYIGIYVSGSGICIISINDYALPMRMKMNNILQFRQYQWIYYFLVVASRLFVALHCVV